MDISKYFTKKIYNFGDIISELVTDLYKINNYNNILFIRTCTTGAWLDDILLDTNVTRILYYTDKIDKIMTSHKSTTIIHSDKFEATLKSLNKSFDLICIDTWHEHKLSLRDFTIISALLNENGILISHDCYPWNEKVANPKYIRGNWCGETYMAFVDFAYSNNNYYYGILNIDTGIGIISKKEFDFLSNKLDKTKQQHLLNLYKYNNFNDYYKYFNENSKDIINAIINK